MPRCSHLTIFLWPSLSLWIAKWFSPPAGASSKRRRNAFYFIFYCRKVTFTTWTKKKCELLDGFRVLPNALLVSEKILTFSGGLTCGIARWSLCVRLLFVPQKPICHEQTLFMPCVWNNNYKGPFALRTKDCHGARPACTSSRWAPNRYADVKIRLRLHFQPGILLIINYTAGGRSAKNKSQPHI